MEERLLEIAREILSRDEMDLSMQREDCEAWDSAAHLILLSELEEELGIVVPFEEVGNIRRLKDFLRFAKE